MGCYYSRLIPVEIWEIISISYIDTIESIKTTSIFGDIIINVTKSINKEKQVFWRLQYIAWFDVPSVLIVTMI